MKPLAMVLPVAATWVSSFPDTEEVVDARVLLPNLIICGYVLRPSMEASRRNRDRSPSPPNYRLSISFGQVCRRLKAPSATS